MNKTVKHLIIAASALTLMSTSALACGGKSCSARQCDHKAGLAQKHAFHKQGHARIPGNTTNYIHKILRKGELIGLSDVQRKQITNLLVKAETGAAGVKAKASALAAEFYGKLRSGGVSDEEVEAYAKRMGELRSERLQANLMASVHAAALLSEEQKAKLYASKKHESGKK